MSNASRPLAGESVQAYVKAMVQPVLRQVNGVLAQMSKRSDEVEAKFLEFDEKMAGGLQQIEDKLGQVDNQLASFSILESATPDADAGEGDDFGLDLLGSADSVTPSVSLSEIDNRIDPLKDHLDHALKRIAALEAEAREATGTAGAAPVEQGTFSVFATHDDVEREVKGAVEALKRQIPGLVAQALEDNAGTIRDIAKAGADGEPGAENEPSESPLGGFN